MIEKYYYNIAISPVTQSCSKNVECNNLTFINQGSQDVTINGVLLLTPGDAITFPGYPGEENVQAYDITFTNDRLLGCRLIMIMKEYRKK